MIRKATSHDIDTIWHIVHSLSQQLLEKGHPNWDLYYTRKIVAEKIEKNDTYVIENEGNVIGTVTLSTNAVEYYPSDALMNFAEPTAEALYITMLGVIPEQQGKGHATKLLEFSEQKAQKQGIHYVRFDVRAFIEDLVRYYLNRQYNIVGVIMDFDEDKTPYFLFEKEI